VVCYVAEQLAPYLLVASVLVARCLTRLSHACNAGKATKPWHTLTPEGKQARKRGDDGLTKQQRYVAKLKHQRKH